MAPTFVCPVDKSELTRDGEWLVSNGGNKYPVVLGVPIIVGGVRVASQAQSLAEEAISQLIDALRIDRANSDKIREIFRWRFQFDQAWIQTEADQFVHRVASTHEGLRNALQNGRPTTTKTEPEVNIAPALMLSTPFRLENTRPDKVISINVRVKNRGACTVSSQTDNPVLLSYHWIDAAGASREGLRTPFLINLTPGSELTLPIFVQTPAKAGKYTLSICPVHEYVRWLTEAAIEFAVEVTPTARGQDDPAWPRTSQVYDYMGDHFEGVRLLTKWRQRFLRRGPIKLVELGGNVSPMIATPDANNLSAAEKINVDIDAYGMLVGNMIRNTPGRNITFLVADGMNLPLQPNWADMIVMFATFHHFPDPIGLLKHLAEFLAPEGLICLMSEPIGHVHKDTQPADYLRELLKGVNEQSFALWEYAQMFKSAGLEVADCRIDVGSLKIALRRPRPRRFWPW